MDLENKLEQADNALKILRDLDSELAYDRICQFTSEAENEYRKLLSNFKKVNGSSKYTAEQKGKSLEDIASFLLEKDNLFKVDRNVRTSTNELDQINSLSSIGKKLYSHGILRPEMELYLSECKNYRNKVSVTYVGKLCSLLQTLSIKLGILFSYHGLTGSGWNYASGLVKKFYLCKENDDERFCIIDFNIENFEQILNGSNLLEIIEAKLKALKIDTNYVKYISNHEAETLLKK